MAILRVASYDHRTFDLTALAQINSYALVSRHACGTVANGCYEAAFYVTAQYKRGS
jgi:hypothetical protein